MAYTLEKLPHHEDLGQIRLTIDALDRQIVPLLVKRFETIARAGHLKVERNIEVILQDRVEQVIEHAKQMAADENPAFSEWVKKTYTALVDLSCQLEADIKKQKGGA